MVDFDCKEKTEVDGVLGGCMAYTRPWAVLHPTVGGRCDIGDDGLQGLDNPNCIRAHFDGGDFAGQGVFSTGNTWHSDLNHTESVDTVEVMQHAAINMLNFALFNGGTFGLQPYVLQKIFVAKSDHVLRKSNMIMYAANFFATVPMLFVGVVYAAKLESGKSAFPAVSGDLMNKGGFSEFVAVVASCSAFAALMSTVDSMVIAANNVFTVDILKNWLMATSTITQLKIASFLVSPVLLFTATAWAIVDNENMDLSYLLTLGSSMVWQIYPVIIISFYTDKITAYPILAGIVVGFFFAVGFASQRKNPDNTGLLIELSPWFSVIANVVTLAIVQLVFNTIGASWMVNDDQRTFDRLDPSVLKQYGPTRLTAHEINEVYLKGCEVPYSTKLNKFLGVACVIISILSCPWYGEPYEKETVSGGFPAWALTQFLLYMLCCCLQIFLVYSWKPAEEPKEEGEEDADDANGDGEVGLINDADHPADRQWETAEESAGKVSKKDLLLGKFGKSGKKKEEKGPRMSSAAKARAFQREVDARHKEKLESRPTRPAMPALDEASTGGGGGSNSGSSGGGGGGSAYTMDNGNNGKAPLLLADDDDATEESGYMQVSNAGISKHGLAAAAAAASGDGNSPLVQESAYIDVSNLVKDAKAEVDAANAAQKGSEYTI